MDRRRVSDNQFQNIKIKHTNKYEKAEQFIIAVMASSQKYKAYVLEKGVSETDFRAENHQELFKLIINNSNVNHDLVNEISDEALKKKLCEYILKGEEKGEINGKSVDDYIQLIKSYKWLKRREEILHQISEYEKSGEDENKIEALLKELQDLKKES